MPACRACLIRSATFLSQRCRALLAWHRTFPASSVRSAPSATGRAESMCRRLAVELHHFHLSLGVLSFCVSDGIDSFWSSSVSGGREGLEIRIDRREA